MKLKRRWKRMACIGDCWTTKGADVHQSFTNKGQWVMEPHADVPGMWFTSLLAAKLGAERYLSRRTTPKRAR